MPNSADSKSIGCKYPDDLLRAAPSKRAVDSPEQNPRSSAEIAARILDLVPHTKLEPAREMPKEPGDMSRFLMSVLLIVITLFLAESSSWYLIGTGIGTLWFAVEAYALTKGTERPE
jgi:hypothetical protein